MVIMRLHYNSESYDKRPTLSIEPSEDVRINRNRVMLASIAFAAGVEERLARGLSDPKEMAILKQASANSEQLAKPEAANALKTKPVSQRYIFNADQTEILREGLSYLASFSNMEIIKTARDKSLQSAMTRASLYWAALLESDNLVTEELAKGWRR